MSIVAPFKHVRVLETHLPPTNLKLDGSLTMAFPNVTHLSVLPYGDGNSYRSVQTNKNLRGKHATSYAQRPEHEAWHALSAIYVWGMAGSYHLLTISRPIHFLSMPCNRGDVAALQQLLVNLRPTVLELRFELFMGKDNTSENLEQALSPSVQCLIVRVEDDTNEYIKTILVGHIWSCCAEYNF